MWLILGGPRTTPSVFDKEVNGNLLPFFVVYRQHPPDCALTLLPLYVQFILVLQTG
jgi:hypothetical protein